MSMSTGCRSMAPLNAECRTRPPPEGLQPSEDETPCFALRMKRKQSRSSWYLASWNVRSLVDVESPLETARQRSETVYAEDRRIDQVVAVLEVAVTALQETKWFGNNVYSVGRSLVLTSGRPTPDSGARQRGEGVALVLRGPAVSCWKAGELGV